MQKRLHISSRDKVELKRGGPGFSSFEKNRSPLAQINHSNQRGLMSGGTEESRKSTCQEELGSYSANTYFQGAKDLDLPFKVTNVEVVKKSDLKLNQNIFTLNQPLANLVEPEKMSPYKNENYAPRRVENVTPPHQNRRDTYGKVFRDSMSKQFCMDLLDPNESSLCRKTNRML